MRTISNGAAMLLLLAATATAQDPWAPYSPPRDMKEVAFRNAFAFKARFPEARLFRLDAERMRGLLRDAPAEGAEQPGVVVPLPVPGGTQERFRLVQAPVLAAALAKRHPQLLAYRGKGVGDPAATARVSLGPRGLSAQIRTPRGTVLVEPVPRVGKQVHASLARGAPSRFKCREIPRQARRDAKAARSHGDTLRVYRLAVACTSDYVAKFGGKDKALDAVHAIVNRVNGIYEQELALRFELVAENEKIIFADPNEDPFAEAEDSNEILDLAQDVIDSRIGKKDYDLGHVFTTLDGGVAYVGVLGGDEKAGGVTGRPDPTGDPFAVDYVAHEIGHQLGAHHTFNGTESACGGNRNASTAYEPGSGTTIMAYAGICGSDDLKQNSDAYFHWASLGQIAEIVAAVPPLRALPTGNGQPTANAPAGRAIPARTPFRLVASASDPDADPLVCSWEQADLGPAAPLDQADDGKIPLFRSRPPAPEKFRYFPELPDVVSGAGAQQDERLPKEPRAMRFIVTVRDRRAGGGALASDEVVLQVVNTGKPFAVTAPGSGAEHRGQIQVRWDVAKTDRDPIKCAHVNIRLSCDGGRTFEMLLSAATPNDGEEICRLPDVACDQGCIMVEAVDNYFFAVSSADLKIRRAAGVVFVAPRTLPGPARRPGAAASDPWVAFISRLPVEHILAVGKAAEVRAVKRAAERLGLGFTRIDKLDDTAAAIARLGRGRRILVVIPRPMVPVAGGTRWEAAADADRIRVFTPGGDVDTVYRLEGSHLVAEK